MIEQWADKLNNIEDVRAYREEAARKSDFERTELNKDKTGVKLDGVAAINPVNGKLKCTIKLAADADKQTAIDTAMAEEKVQHAIEGKQIVKQIVVPGKIVNLVVK